MDYFDRPEWVKKMEEAVAAGDLEQFDRLYELHPEIINMIDDWCGKHGIPIPEN